MSESYLPYYFSLPSQNTHINHTTTAHSFSSLLEKGRLDIFVHTKKRRKEIFFE